MKRLALAVMICLLMLAGAAFAEAPGLSIDAPREEICPGRPVVVSFTVPEDGTCSIGLENGEGVSLVISENRSVTAGYNAMYWNGTCGGVPVPEGEWRLIIRMDGETAETSVTIGRMIPVLISAQLENTVVEESDTVLLSFYATEEGTLLLHETGEDEPLYWENVEAGNREVSFQAETAPGTHELVLTLVGEDGVVSEPATLTLEVLEKEDPNAIPPPEPLPEYLREKGENGFTPAHTSPRRGEDQTLNYWTLPMDITDEEAVWKVLTAPVTILDNGASARACTCWRRVRNGP